MKSNQTFWGKLTYVERVVTLAGSTIVLAGSLWAGFTIIDNKNDKLDATASQVEVIQMFQEVKHEIRAVRHSTDSSNIVLSSKIDGLSQGVSILGGGLVTHIRKDTTISANEKLDAILRIVQNINTEIKKN
jgi:hypothetical protein